MEFWRPFFPTLFIYFIFFKKKIPPPLVFVVLVAVIFLLHYINAGMIATAGLDTRKMIIC